MARCGVLVISDEVNPNNLSDAQLAQPGISSALNAANSGLALQGSATEVSSECIDDALTALSSAQPPQVVVYFAHRPARGYDRSDRQAALTSALEAQWCAVAASSCFTMAGTLGRAKRR